MVLFAGKNISDPNLTVQLILEGANCDYAFVKFGVLCKQGARFFGKVCSPIVTMSLPEKHDMTPRPVAHSYQENAAGKLRRSYDIFTSCSSVSLHVMEN